jgi:cytochrome c biogenesis protein CcmG, thiol:disulfide interchange protein DsbE
MSESSPIGKRLWAFAPFVLFAGLLVIVWVTLSSGGARNENFATGMLGKPVPAFELAPLRDGAPITPATFAGKRYLVNFFASWCVPCRYEHPLLMELKQRGVAIVGVAYKDAPEKAEAFLQREGDPYVAIGQDPTGRLGLELGIAGVPETFVIDEDGKILALNRGPITEDVVREKILPALGSR